MPVNLKTSWTDRDFDNLSWHDNHVHGFTISESPYGVGDMTLDLDYILEWLKSESGSIQFRIAPASLTFHNVSDLKLALDYASVSAATGPFSIAGIERRFEHRERYTAIVWIIAINWPKGSISFEATGFTQKLCGPSIIKAEQLLKKDEQQIGI
jgi:hypothetical protein